MNDEAGAVVAFLILGGVGFIVMALKAIRNEGFYIWNPPNYSLGEAFRDIGNELKQNNSGTSRQVIYRVSPAQQQAQQRLPLTRPKVKRKPRVDEIPEAKAFK